MPSRAPEGKIFAPKSVLFSPATDCNLSCAHCSVERVEARLPAAAAVRFLRTCRRAGIDRIGFTGGEPFLYASFLFAVATFAVRNGFFFDRVTTNAVWFRGRRELKEILETLRDRGYDGTFGVSVDAFHAGDPAKVALFLKTAAAVWDRPDIAQIISVRGAGDARTEALLERLAGRVEGRFERRGGRRVLTAPGLEISLAGIDLVPVGKAAVLADPWDGRWFKEDFCLGPGHVLYVLPDGTVKPCCGYATDSGRMTIGDIRKDSAAAIVRRARRNPFVRAVFEKGLVRIRRGLQESGVRFPGKTGRHCFFCRHVLTGIPAADLDEGLRRALAGPGPHRPGTGQPDRNLL